MCGSSATHFVFLGGGSYNEVLIDMGFYNKMMPWGVAAVFFLEGGEASGQQCAKKAKDQLKQWYKEDADHVLLVKHIPGASPGFEEWQPSESFWNADFVQTSNSAASCLGPKCLRASD